MNESQSVGTADRIGRLEDIEAIKKLKASYCWGVDNKLWAQWRELFTDDMEFYLRDSVLGMGGDNFVAAVQRGMEGRKSVHQVHSPLIEIVTPTTATGRWLLNDRITNADGTLVEGWGYYLDEYVKGRDGRWRIRRSKVDYLEGGMPPRKA